MSIRPIYLAKQSEHNPRGFEWRGSISKPALTRTNQQRHAAPLPLRVAVFVLLVLAAAATVALRALL